MPTPQELRAEADRIEREQETLRIGKQIEQIKALSGKTSLTITKHQHGNAIKMVTATGVSKAGNIQGEAVTLWVRPKATDYLHAGVCPAGNEDIDASAGTFPGQNEITPDKARAIKHLVVRTIRSLAAEIASIAGSKLDPNTPADWLPEADPGKREHDYPHLVLTPSESVYVPKDYMLPGYRYVLSRASVAAALSQIDGEERSDARISHLVQSCDMDYLHSKRRTLEGLRAKLATHTP